MNPALDGPLGPQRNGTRTFLIIEGEPISWAIPTNHVLKMSLGEFRGFALLDLDAILGITSASVNDERTVVVQTPQLTYALRTRCRVHLATFDSAASSPIPSLVFGRDLEHALTRQLLFADDGRATLVLAVDALAQLASPTRSINAADIDRGVPLP